MLNTFIVFDQLEKENIVHSEIRSKTIQNDIYNYSKQILIDHPIQNKKTNEIKTELIDVFTQRKIVPWEVMESYNNDLIKKSICIKQKIIIVASLIDKIPNLAGLTRTCEIFQAEQLILPNMKCTKSKGFKQISASADTWINVPIPPGVQLHNFLNKKRSEGYNIIGLEQTSTSQCITEYKFPEQTVLILGMEGKGVPAEYLKNVDACIEIPQLGIIRSLNVHVSGAILLWEYTRQRIVNSD
eukprot:GSMAST32.ASY1.ANO1.1461.1 assembled CDS